MLSTGAILPPLAASGGWQFAISTGPGTLTQVLHAKIVGESITTVLWSSPTRDLSIVNLGMA